MHKQPDSPPVGLTGTGASRRTGDAFRLWTSLSAVRTTGVVAVDSLRLTGGCRRWCRSGWMPLVTLHSDELVVDEVMVEASVADQLPDHEAV